MAKIKDKERILGEAREKQQVTYKGTPIRLSANFLAETLQATREWHTTFKVMKGKNLQPRILYLVRLSFRFDGEIKSLTEKQKLKDFSTTTPDLQETFRDFSKQKRKGHNWKHENYERKKSHWQRETYNKGCKSATCKASRKV